MALVQHVHRVEVRIGFGLDQFVEHKEQSIGVDAAGIEIVVAVFAVVEVKSAQLAELR